MTVKNVRVVICDECEVEIAEEEYVDAMVYGVAFHTQCINNMTAFGVVKLLGLDDIRTRKTETGEEVRRFWLPMPVRKDA